MREGRWGTLRRLVEAWIDGTASTYHRGVGKGWTGRSSGITSGTIVSGWVWKLGKDHVGVSFGGEQGL